MKQLVKTLIDASIEATRMQIAQATCEEELDQTALRAVSILMKAIRIPVEGPSEDAIMDTFAAFGAHALLVAYIRHAPNTEKMLAELDVGNKIYLETLESVYASAQASRSSDSEED